MTRPFLKWAGGKRTLAPALLPLIPERFRAYHEPMLGGGALYLTLRPQRALLADANPDLIATWTAVRDEVDAVVRLLKRLAEDVSEETYYKVRALGRPAHTAAAAARFIYLNKTCFNGLYRVNLAGQFNVPWGRKTDATQVLDEANLRAVSRQLQDVDLAVAPFEQSLRRVRRHDVVYLDPPYDKTHSAYTERGFSEKQHADLAEWFFQLAGKGAFPILTNSDTPLVRKLFKGATIAPLVGRTTLAANSDGRGDTVELVITPKPRRKTAP